MKEVQQVCHESFKGVSRKFPRCFKEVLRVFQESLKGISRKFQVIERNSKGISGISRSFKEVSRGFQTSF